MRHFWKENSWDNLILQGISSLNFKKFYNPSRKIKSRSTASALLSAYAPDYRHTDKHLRLVMTLISLCCTRQSRAPNIDRCALEIWPRPLTLTNDLDPTFDLDLKGQTVQTGECTQTNGQTNGRTDRRTLPSTLSPCFAKATRSIIIISCGVVGDSISCDWQSDEKMYRFH